VVLTADAAVIAEMWRIMGEMPVAVEPDINPHTGAALALTLHLRGNYAVKLNMAGMLVVNDDWTQNLVLQGENEPWLLLRYLFPESA
jgi:hypothetical protein